MYRSHEANTADIPSRQVVTDAHIPIVKESSAAPFPTRDNMLHTLHTLESVFNRPKPNLALKSLPPGPSSSTCWVIPNRLCMGPALVGPESSTVIAALLEQGILSYYSTIYLMYIPCNK